MRVQQRPHPLTLAALPPSVAASRPGQPPAFPSRPTTFSCTSCSCATSFPPALTMGRARGLLLVMAACLLAGGASAARLEAQAVTIAAPTATGSPAAASSVDHQGPTYGSPSRSLLTYFMSITKPQLQLTSAGAGGATRPGRTALTVMLSEPAAVSPWMPVVSPRPDGMTHNVVHTWAALKNYALMFARVNAVNKQAAPGATRLFPLPGVAVQAASDVSPFGKLDVGRIIDTAEAHGQRSAWTEPSPGSVLLLPQGSSTAAVADVMNIAHDEQSGAITLHLELVHSPHTISEFEAHGKQSLDVHEAHYHFATPPGVAIDAAGLLAALQDAKLEVAGLHVFVKGKVCAACCASFTAPPVSTEVAVGNTFTVTVVATDLSACNNVTKRNSRTGDVVGASAEVNLVEEFVGLSLTGPAEFVTQNVPIRLPNKRATTVNLDVSGGSGSIEVRANGPGLVTVTLDDANGSTSFDSSRRTVIVTARNVSTVVAKLLLTPHKARRHVHEHIAVTAVALDTSDSPVAGALVAFSAFGDCLPQVHPSAAVTNDKGWATVHLTSHEPGAVAVVAATAGANGVTITSPPSHIIWAEEEHHEREDYYGRDAQSYADAAARLAAAEVTKATTAAAAVEGSA